MVERLENHAESLQEHELLEILLYNAIPRKNTNELAHALLERFGSLSAVFHASASALAGVEGLGEQTADYLRCLSLCLQRIRFEPSAFPPARNFAAFSKLLEEKMRGLDREFIELYATDLDGNILGMETYGTNERQRSSVDPGTLTKFFVKHAPKAVVVAHNHLGASAAPSERDDLFTRQMQCVCAFYGVRLLDHIIVSQDDIFSYYMNSRFDRVRTIPIESVFSFQQV